MAERIAVASRDNVVVHQHFGRTTHFQIYDLTDSGFTFVETRENTPSCGASQENGAESHEKVVELLSDCKAVLVAKIGPGAVEVLNAHNLKAFVAPESIESALAKLVKSGWLTRNTEV
jgi:predicted Fe-Mo cluster-binding NifX family protein